jgi:hypothetical protein
MVSKIFYAFFIYRLFVLQLRSVHATEDVAIITSYIAHRPCSYSLWQGHCAMQRSCRQCGGNAHRNVHWQHRASSIPERLYKITTAAHIYYWLYTYIKMLFWCEATQNMAWYTWSDLWALSVCWSYSYHSWWSSCYFCPYNQGCSKLGHSSVAPLCFREYWGVTLAFLLNTLIWHILLACLIVSVYGWSISFFKWCFVCHSDK